MAPKHRRPKKGTSIRWLADLYEWLPQQDDVPVSLLHAKALSADLFLYADRDGKNVFVSQRELQKRNRLSSRYVSGYRNYLLDNGWMHDSGQREGRGGTPIYWLTNPIEVIPPREEPVPTRTDSKTDSKTDSSKTPLPGGTLTPTTDDLKEVGSRRGLTGSANATPDAPEKGASESVAEEENDATQGVADGSEKKTISNLIAVFNSWSDDDHAKVRGISWHNHDLTAQLVQHSTWTTTEFDAVMSPPPEIRKSPTGWLIKVLENLPDDPSEHPEIGAARQAAAETEAEEEFKELKRVAFWLAALSEVMGREPNTYGGPPTGDIEILGSFNPRNVNVHTSFIDNAVASGWASRTPSGYIQHDPDMTDHLATRFMSSPDLQQILMEYGTRAYQKWCGWIRQEINMSWRGDLEEEPELSSDVEGVE